ncbi:hypothetical protein [Elstera cyanobacteriorum]|uniref:hypothetical protein n=1 Tax=Elstera cyanobacteriorum TaxID=2022747 RepID=UPI0023573E99|nr:hypothetical protein [Elstera cyanobacteriorum]MCK6444077.1 hypothetical protein [Elstera cyanobacteriorum]
MARFRLADRRGELTPPLPCAQCRALFRLEILTWETGYCACRPDCDAERADAQARCPACGSLSTITYADEGSLVDLAEWFGGTAPQRWHCQVWGSDTPSLEALDAPMTPENRWLAEIAALLDNNAYPFPSPKDRS